MPYRIMAFLFAMLMLGSALALADDGTDKARRHLVRGLAAIEMAKSDAELSLAVDEFKAATEIAPGLAAAWYNLGAIQAKTGQPNAAIASYQRYLSLAPTAEDAPRIRDEIIKLEFRLEQSSKSQSRQGVWMSSDGTVFHLSVQGNRLALKANSHFLTEEDAESTYPIATAIVGTTVTNPEELAFSLELRGNRLAGTWRHSAIQADKCTIPEESGDVEGEILVGTGQIVLRYTRTKYKAATSLGLLTDDSCREVRAMGRRQIEMRFTGPLPAGGIGVALDLTYQPGRIVLKNGWYGHVAVQNVDKESPAYAAGLRDADEILAIDGVEVKTLKPDEVVWRLRGTPGMQSELRILHKKEKEPVTIKATRIDVLKDQATRGIRF